MQRVLVEMEDLEAGGVRGHSAAVGVAALQREQSTEALLAAARSALEQSRAAGGGQTVIFQGDEESSEDALASSHGDVIAALASALGERDRYTGEHSESVVELTARVGEALALDAEEIARVRTAALLHDIGKVGVPDAILHKPGPLDDEEWAFMRRHTLLGERILTAAPALAPVARIVRSSHERMDGRGYPDGLAGADIPLGARIVFVCDAFDAMTSDRPYAKGRPPQEALSELRRCAGKQFDPEVVEALATVLAQQAATARRAGQALRIVSTT
jgi:HD-GYP domain-containing protein (c-di-GMP phosphodiesterase class II)